MAANGYYQESAHAYRPYDFNNPSRPYEESPYTRPAAVSAAPSYHTTTPPHHDGLSLTSSYADTIPLKTHQPNIQIQPTPYPAQQSAYPVSPEAQAPDARLLSRTEKKKKRWHSGKIPWFVYLMTLVQLTIFIVELVKNSLITGSVIMTKPQFNPMIGPSTYVLINMGARFVPCMRPMSFPGTTTRYPETPWPCPNTTSVDASSPSNQCSLGQLCGFTFDYAQPNQWFRFITPMFLHAGIIHIGFNILLQLTIGRDMEKAIGTIRFAIVYLSSGIFGFALGANFAPSGIASTGASGALFGVIALLLLDLLYTWKERETPFKDLMWILFDIAISFVLGLLPGLDNFSHIGGFLMGLALGICILHSPSILRERTRTKGHRSQYSAVSSDLTLMSGAAHGPTKGLANPTTTIARPADLTGFTKEPLGFFKNRKLAWWIWWLIRAGALVGVLVGFIVLVTNFYSQRHECKWCKYLSCLDITVNGRNWCDLGYLNFPQNGTKAKRMMEGVFDRERSL